MSEKASAEVMDLLTSLDEEFGKKVKARSSINATTHKTLNTEFHKNNPQANLASAKGQLERMKFENYYDWEMHKQNLHQIDRAQRDIPELKWLPEAQVSFIIHQQCSCCKETTTFVGNEYIRFRGQRRLWRDLQKKVHSSYPTMLKLVAEVDGNLLAYGLPGGDPLPDLIEEMNETVRRCAGCILMERQALDLWVTTVQPSPQGELIIDIPLLEDGR